MLELEEEGEAEPPKNCQLTLVGLPVEVLVNSIQSPEQIVAVFAEKLATGGTQLLTVIPTVAKAGGHEPLVTSTVYTVLADGVAIGFEQFVQLNPVEGVHKYVPPPVAVNAVF